MHDGYLAGRDAPSRWPAAHLVWWSLAVVVAVAVAFAPIKIMALHVIWPANAIVIGVLLFVPRRQLVRYAIVLQAVMLAAKLALGVDTLLSIGTAVGNVVAIAWAVGVLRRDPHWIAGRERIASWLRFTVLGVLVPFAATGVLVAVVTGVLSGGSRPAGATVETGLLYATSNCVACMLLVPAILRLRRGRLRALAPESRTGTAGLLVLLVLLAGLTTLLMTQPSPVALFAVPLPLLVIAVRYGAPGAAAGSLIVVPVVLVLTTAGVGPFQTGTQNTATAALWAQVFLVLLMAGAWSTLAALDESGRGVRQLERDNAELRLAAATDPLTLLPNRRTLAVAQAAAWAAAAAGGTPLSVLVIDIDCFKDYNDRLGHAQGDRALVAVAGAIRSGANRPGDVAARLGGEEFVVLLPYTDGVGAVHVGEAIRHAVRDIGLPHGTGVVTVSIGAATAWPLAARTDDGRLFGAADAALYRAKSLGRDRVETGTLT